MSEFYNNFCDATKALGNQKKYFLFESEPSENISQIIQSNPTIK